ncbi:hypothetical protein DAI22_05g040900 [Oryza sativa Japonica Group]|nr:hypothetical protein DAI22_05g040900 [Oryza sativa Japonica Group]
MTEHWLKSMLCERKKLISSRKQNSPAKNDQISDCPVALGCSLLPCSSKLSRCCTLPRTCSVAEINLVD